MHQNPFTLIENNAGLNRETIILGIDPGTIKMGYAIVRKVEKVPILMDYGTLHLSHIESQHEKLNQIFSHITALITKYHPSDFAIEAPFFGKNVQSMLKLGRAQGVAIAAAISHNLLTAEYSPRKVKQSVAGNGNASKEQVSRMIEKQFNIDLTGVSLDATDAISVAICHSFARSTANKNGSAKGWSSFIKSNPDRVI